MSKRLDLDKFKEVTYVVQEDLNELSAYAVGENVDRVLPTDDLDQVCEWLDDVITRWGLDTNRTCERAAEENIDHNVAIRAQLVTLFLSGVLLGKKLGVMDIEDLKGAI